jgi:hypothetical protein
MGQSDGRKIDIWSVYNRVYDVRLPVIAVLKYLNICIEILNCIHRMIMLTLEEVLIQWKLTLRASSDGLFCVVLLNHSH